MKRLRLLLICFLVPIVHGIRNERKVYKRQTYGQQALPLGVNQPLIPPTFGNDKGDGNGQYLDYEDSNTLPGVPGSDYPIYGPNPPSTDFSCATVPHLPGYYANVDYGCQVFHICEQDGKVNTFLCPNGTVYNQQFFVCDWWYNVNCADATGYYSLNGDLYKVPPGGWGHYTNGANGGGYTNGNGNGYTHGIHATVAPNVGYNGGPNGLNGPNGLSGPNGINGLHGPNGLNGNGVIPPKPVRPSYVGAAPDHAPAAAVAGGYGSRHSSNGYVNGAVNQY